MIGNKPALMRSFMKREMIFAFCLSFASGLNSATAADVFRDMRQGDVAAVRAWAQSANDLEARDIEGNTPLIASAFAGTPAMVEILLARGADVNATNSWGANALQRGSYDFEKVRLLTGRGARVNAQSQIGNTPLMLAARVYGNSRSVKLLLDAGAEVNRTNMMGANPLMAAVAANDERSVRLLLQAGADVNLQPAPSDLSVVWGGGRTPLMWSAFRGNTRIARLLLARGARVDLPGGWGTPLSHAAWNEQTRTAELLLEHGAPVDQPEPFSGFTPLHWAASSESGRTDLVKLLLAAGANPNAEGGETIDAFMGIPQTPLLLAKKRGETSIVRELERAGARCPAGELKTATPIRSVELSLESLRIALKKAVDPLQDSVRISRDSFLRHASKQDCISCHQQNLPMAAVALAHAAGIPVAKDQTLEQVRLVLDKDFAAFTREPTFHPDAAHTLGYAAFGLAAGKVEARDTDDWVHHLSLIQGKDGQWHNNLPRPPLQTSDAAATALAVHALQVYSFPARSQEFASRIERAKKWLWKLQPANHEERAYQLLGLHWAGEPAPKLHRLANALLAQQHSDGGWGQLPRLESDAYATGLALFALHRAAAIAFSEPPMRTGAEFLLATQEDDGTWHVVRRAFPFQPTMRSGFPHGRDGWISAAGSSWATMALALTLADLQNQTQFLSLK
jgi:ankyrin repeat protein